MTQLACFKAYDIRGRVPDQLNEGVAYRVGRAFADYLGAKRVIVGHDIRLTSESLSDALINGLTDAGVDVLHIGQCGTEEVYFATFSNKVDGGICVTASHNPMDYNGMKFVREGSKPISGDTGLFDIKRRAEESDFLHSDHKGRVVRFDSRSEYLQHILSYVDLKKLKPLKIVSNPGNGGAGMVMDALEKVLPFEFIKVHNEPDGTFPNGIPNPLEEHGRSATINAVKDHNADLGIAWDGDFDRCFFFDENGRFIEGYYIVGILAEAFLKKHPGSAIVHDPRLTWNTIDLVQNGSGVPVQSKTGHAFIKERMRLEDAVYGGEMSAHHYFKDFAYCDSGMIPWLLLVELLCTSGKRLSEMVDNRMAEFPCSGEINATVADPTVLLERVEKAFSNNVVSIDKIDGLSMNFENWRFNLRLSNTEPVVRLNVESRQDENLMKQKTQALLSIIKAA